MKNKSIKITATPEQLVTEYQAGATLQELAAKYGCSRQNIHQRLNNAGISLRSPGITKKFGPIMLRTCPTCERIFRPTYKPQRFCCLEHIRKISVCKYGHEMTEENRYHYPGSNSRCKICCRRRNKAAAERRKQRRVLEKDLDQHEPRSN